MGPGRKDDSPDRGRAFRAERACKSNLSASIARYPPNILRPSPVVKVYCHARSPSAQPKYMPKCRSTEKKPNRIVMKSVQTLAVPTTATMATQTGASAPLPKPRACDPAALDIFPCDPCPKRIAKNRMPKSHAQAPCTQLCARLAPRRAQGGNHGNSDRSFPGVRVDRDHQVRSPVDQARPEHQGPDAPGDPRAHLRRHYDGLFGGRVPHTEPGG